MTDPADEFTEDAFLGGQLCLRQPRSGHRAGHDAMLLAAAAGAVGAFAVGDCARSESDASETEATAMIVSTPRE